MCALFAGAVEICKHRPLRRKGERRRRDKFCICRACIIAACLFTKVTPEECKFFIKQICRRHLSAKSSSTGTHTLPAQSETFNSFFFAHYTSMECSSFQNNVDILVSQPTSLLFIRKVARLLARPLPECVRVCVCLSTTNCKQRARHALPPRVYLSTSWVYCEIPPSQEMRRV
jgi:hypothetical protein